MSDCNLCHQPTSETYKISYAPRPLCDLCAKEIAKQYMSKIVKNKAQKNKTL